MVMHSAASGYPRAQTCLRSPLTAVDRFAGACGPATILKTRLSYERSIKLPQGQGSLEKVAKRR